MTTQAPREVWNDSLDGDFLWTRENFSEAVPSVMTPATWSLFDTYFVREVWRPLTAVPGTNVVGNIGGRAYANLSLFRSLGGERMVRQTMGEAFGRLASIDAVPPLAVARTRVMRSVMTRAPRFARAVFPYLRGFSNKVEAVRARSVTVHDKVRSAATTDELARLWHSDVDPLLRAACRLFAAGGRQGGTAILTLGPWLRRRGVSEGDINALLTTSDPASLASLGPIMGLEELRTGRIDAATSASRWGHRCSDEFEVTASRPAEDPAWIAHQLTALEDAPVDIASLLRRRDKARTAALEQFARRHPHRMRALRRRMHRAEKGFRGREAGRSEVNRAFWVARTFWLRAGTLTGEDDDLAFLTVDELLAVLGGDSQPLARVEARRRTFDHYRALPPYPVIIRGPFDLDAWSAEHDHSAARGGDHTAAATTTGTINGFPGAAGQVRGRARVLTSMSEADCLCPGEILVTSVTNVGWTPLFPLARAVITDLGAPHSHAAIVARELGIPAVVGCGDATTRLHTGDLLHVDGSAGTVEVLEPAEHRRATAETHRGDR